MNDRVDGLRKRREELAFNLNAVRESERLAPSDIIARAARSMQSDLDELDKQIASEERLEERNSLEDSPMARLFYAVADMFQYDYWYIEDPDEFKRQVKQVQDRLARHGLKVEVTKC